MLKQLVLLIVLSVLTTFHLNAQTWNQKANLPTTARHRSISFSIGNKGYVGLGHLNTVSNIVFQDFWEYNPASNTWTQKSDFAGSARYHAHAFAIGKKGYVTAGTSTGGNYFSDSWEYDPATNAWTPIANLPGPGRRGGVAFVVDNIGYVGSGYTSGGGSNNFYGYNPLTNVWTQVASFPGLERVSAVAFAIDSLGYIGTGDPFGAANSSKDFWEFNPNQNLWTQKADVGDSVRREACSFALGGFGYIGAGMNTNIMDDVSDFWKYDPVLDSWNEVEEFLGISRRYMVSFVIAGKAYTSLGTNGINFNDLWEYNAEYVPAFVEPNIAKTEVEFSESGNNIYNIGFKNLLGSHNDMRMVITDRNGKIIEDYPIVSGNVTLQTSQLPDNCVYRLMKGGKVFKSGKINPKKTIDSLPENNQLIQNAN